MDILKSKRMILAQMSNGEIVHELKQDFSSEELNKVMNTIDQLVKESESIEELKVKINDLLYFETSNMSTGI